MRVQPGAVSVLAHQRRFNFEEPHQHTHRSGRLSLRAAR